MKKLLGILLILNFVCISAFAKEATTVCANHILVENEMDAIKLKSQIKSFDDFKYYAKIYSSCPSGRNGGSLGCFGKRQMVKPFEDAAFTGELNQVSEPVKTQFGYHLLWITDRY